MPTAPLAALLHDPAHRTFWDTAFTAALTGLAMRKAYTGNTAIRFPDDLVEDAALIAGAATETRAALFAAATR